MPAAFWKVCSLGLRIEEAQNRDNKYVGRFLVGDGIEVGSGVARRIVWFGIGASVAKVFGLIGVQTPQ